MSISIMLKIVLPITATPRWGSVHKAALPRRVPVRINDALTLNFTLDSGASDVLIPADAVMTLLRTETLSLSDFIGAKTYVLADGSKLPSMRFRLRELRVGGHRLENVTASAGPPTSEPLLGQSFLSRSRSSTLDNRRHVLVLVEMQSVVRLPRRSHPLPPPLRLERSLALGAAGGRPGAADWRAVHRAASMLVSLFVSPTPICQLPDSALSPLTH
jgi:hypothetical protein